MANPPNIVANPGFEVDTSGWLTIGSATIVRDTTQFDTGVASLKITHVSGADGAYYSGGPQSLLPGNLYAISFRVRLNSGSGGWASDFDAYDQAGNFLQAISVNPFTPSAAWTTISATAVAPRTAFSFNLTFFTSAATGSINIDNVSVTQISNIALPPPTIRVGLILGSQPPHLATDPQTDISAFVRESISIGRGRSDELNRVEVGTANVPVDNTDRRFEPEFLGYANYVYEPSMEATVAGWFAANSATVSQDATNFFVGSKSLKVVTNGVASDEGAGITLGSFVPQFVLRGNDTYTLSAYVRPTTSATLKCQIGWQDITGAIIYYDPSPAVVCPAAVFTRLSVSKTAPANAVSCVLFAVLTQGTQAKTINLDAVQFEAQPAATPYFDGAQPGARWQGTAHESISYQGAPYAPYVVPGVGLAVTAIYPGPIVNYCPNPSGEATGIWIGWGDSGTVTLSYTGAGGVIGRGSNNMRLTKSGGVAGYIGLYWDAGTLVSPNGAMPVTIGQSVCARSTVRLTAGPAGSIFQNIRFYDASGNVFSELGIQTISSPVVGTVYNLSGTVQAPAGAVAATTIIYASSATSTTVLDVDNVLLASPNPDGSVPPYVDGTMAGYGWLDLLSPNLSPTVFGRAYPLHTGLVSSWPMTWPGAKQARSTIDSSDLFDFLNNAPFVGIVSFGNAATMISTVLDAAFAVSSFAYTNLDTGQEVILGVDASTDPQGVAALGLIQDIADSDGGLLFVNGKGQVVFHDRDHRLTSGRSIISQATFGDGGPATNEYPYLSPETDYGIDRIFNYVTVSSGLATPTVIPQQDTISQDKYGTRAYSKSTLLQSDAAANGQAATILALNKDPHLRFTSLQLEPMRYPNLWGVVLGMEISDRVTVNRRPYGVGGGMISLSFFVEAIKHEISLDPFKWTTTLSLSLTDQNTYWILGDASYGILDSTTRLR